ncbi:unnamed protein product [Paramecium sonneborni]|uniref:Uncharacterized protein n=1 Tax=Paramecium sonneborni TaxID=65129 RepID=A0A8S1K146_9CILI|nr:unnamed protein product [Paramecium sonneborni]
MTWLGQLLTEQTKSLSNFMFVVSIQQDQIKELSLIDQKDLCKVLQNRFHLLKLKLFVNSIHQFSLKQQSL